MIKKLILILMIMIGGCDMQDKNNEIANKSEYSVLQSYEYEYRKAKNDRPYMVFKRALNTGVTVVAFPIKNKSHGYVVILANSKNPPSVKYIPNVDFVVTQDAYLAVKSQASLSREVEQFIAKHVPR
jgi:hypothetical protein